MEKELYVHLHTLYEKKESATVDGLSSCYQNKTLLREVVDNLLGKCITSEVITNKSVLIKPNWVKQDVTPDDPICLRTNDNLLLVVLEYVAALKPAKIMVGDAPIQDCKWDLMLKPEVKESILNLGKKYNLPIEIKDFRRVVSDFENNETARDLKDLDKYIIFDVGEKSMLEPITTDKNLFRVTKYDPDKMAKVHQKGIHKYCVIKDIFDYDVIITMPKMKTHRMAGLTNSLKILVGINGDKEYLPHHRKGAKGHGGDCYNGFSVFRCIAEEMNDIANRRIGTGYYKIIKRTGNLFWKLSFPGKHRFDNAGWYGNDTIWRTVIDLNRVALYGTKDGSLEDRPQRQLLTICDGIIGGQGDGPMHPIPLPLGILAVSNNPYLMDVVASKLFAMNTEKIPLINEARKIIEGKQFELTINENPIAMGQLKDYAVEAIMPPGWIDYDKK